MENFDTGPAWDDFIGEFPPFQITPYREQPVSFKRSTPKHLVNYWRQSIETNPYYNSAVEQCVAVLLNIKYQILGHSIVSIGTVDSTECHPREVFRAAIIYSAYAVAVIHNHPHQCAKPSGMDKALSRRLATAGKIVGIKLAWSIVVTDREFSVV